MLGEGDKALPGHGKTLVYTIILCDLRALIQIPALAFFYYIESDIENISWPSEAAIDGAKPTAAYRLLRRDYHKRQRPSDLQNFDVLYPK